MSLGAGVFEQEPSGSGLERAQHQLIGVKGGEHDDLRRAGLGAEQPGGGDAVEAWHADVHKDDVGMVQVGGG